MVIDQVDTKVMPTFLVAPQNDRAQAYVSSFAALIKPQIPSADAIRSYVRQNRDTPEAMTPVMDYIYDNRQQYQYNTAKTRQTLVDFTARWVSSGKGFIEAVARETDTEKKRTLLGVCVNSTSLTVTLDKVRETLTYKMLTPDDRSSVERVGKLLLGLEEDDPRAFFTALEDVYKNIHFENYPTNIEATARDIGMIKRLLQEKGITKAAVLDVGCGTGRISNALAADPDIGSVIGIDPSDNNLAKAKEQDTTGKVQYLAGTWNELDELVQDESVDAIVIIGRTLCHARGPKELVGLFERAAKKLRPAAKNPPRTPFILCDLPDPNKGLYLENRKQTLQVYRALRIPLPGPDEQYLPEVDHVVDSADDGQSLFDRYTPDINEPYADCKATLKQEIEATAGLDIQEAGRAPIDGWGDSANIFLQATKLTPEETRQKWMEFTMSSSH